MSADYFLYKRRAFLTHSLHWSQISTPFFCRSTSISPRLLRKNTMTPNSTRRTAASKAIITMTTLLVFCTLIKTRFDASHLTDSDYRGSQETGAQGNYCWTPQTLETSEVNSSIYEQIKETLSEAKYQAKSISRFQSAIQVDTQVNDDFSSVDKEERWSKFNEFSVFLAKEFPLVHQSLSLERVNSHGLLYSWIPTQGREDCPSAAKPFLLMAHQDTVSVSNKSLSDWKFNPFEGHIDENGIMYGRGVHDDKNSLISILEAAELLLQNGFSPNRPAIFAFGFDEEVSGQRGALQISKFLEERYGRDGLEFILDEGPGITVPVASGSNAAYATVATSEKGYLDVSIEAKAPGGHSSLAGKHSLIGMVAEMVTSLENTEPFLARVSKNNPVLDYLSCKDFDDQRISVLIEKIRKGDAEAEFELGTLLQNTTLAPLVLTSQGIDLISGGQKINALPERVSVGINYRLIPGTSLKEVKRRVAAILEPIGVKYGMHCSFFSPEKDVSSFDRYLRVSQIGKALEPAQTSPQNSTAFSVVFGTVSSALGPFYSDVMHVKTLRVVPSLMAGNTDTRHYWNLTRNLFRFRPTRIDSQNNAGHTTNEHLYAKDHYASVQFYASLILNASDM
ncbi:LAMI_0A00386g1_1 [Lachancea mirantina]|uniref:LAMI_0A00386g1_1 n=1 Tax=Lachancea mirantina TaxID=1230905 RepID=A0A1G4IL99_9SACH|nr:LAMI_0A00386g1_1 [Lachancea mirantina]